MRCFGDISETSDLVSKQNLVRMIWFLEQSEIIMYEIIVLQIFFFFRE